MPQGGTCTIFLVMDFILIAYTTKGSKTCNIQAFVRLIPNVTNIKSIKNSIYKAL